MSKEGKNGVSANTPKAIQFGAGTIHKGLIYTEPTYELTEDESIIAGKTYYTRSGSSPDYVYTVVTNPVSSGLSSYYEMTDGGWNFSASVVCATSGGSKLTITPEITTVEVDGALVKTKGLDVKTGETANMEINFIELTKDVFKAATIGREGAFDDANYELIEGKPDINEGDYWDNIAFVGKTLDGKNIIAILENALCTSGFELSGENKSAGVATLTFECYAELDSDLDVLPWKIYYPKIA